MCTLSFMYKKNADVNSLEEFAGIFFEGKTGTKKTINGTEWLIIKDEYSAKIINYSYYWFFHIIT